MKYFPLCFLLFFCSYDSIAQLNGAAAIDLIKDINDRGDSHVKNLIAGKQYVFFTADDGLHGSELWRSDGTNEGTSLIKDINPGSLGSNIDNVIYFHDTLYFVADDGTHGYELWKSDGTSEGTLMITDISTGSANSFTPPSTSGFAFPDRKFIAGSGDLVYFSLAESTNDKRLWRTNGTAIGTYPVSIQQGVRPAYLTDVNGVLYFAINDNLNGTSLWKSDGAVAGTEMVKVIDSSGKGVLSNFVNFNGKLFFVLGITDLATGNTADYLWLSNGTSAGTIKALLLFEFLILKSTVLGENLYFSGAYIRSSRYQPNPIGLMLTDGHVMNSGIDGPYFSVGQVNTISPTNLRVFNNTLYFTSEAGMLYKMDTNSNSIKLLDKFRNDSYTLSLSPTNTMLYVVVNAGNSIDLWKVKDPVVCQVLSQNVGILTEQIVVGKKLFLAIKSQIYGGTEIFVYDAANDQDTPCRVQQTISGLDAFPSKLTTDPPFGIQASASSGLPVNFSSSNEKVAVVSSNNIVTITGEGETVITATQPGNDEYLAAPAITQTLVVDMVLSAEETISSKSYITFSNPFHHEFVVRVNETTHTNFGMVIYNSIGSLIESDESLLCNTDYKFGGSWLPGVYFLKVISGDQSHVEKIIKQ